MNGIFFNLDRCIMASLVTTQLSFVCIYVENINNDRKINIVTANLVPTCFTNHSRDLRYHFPLMYKD